MTKQQQKGLCRIGMRMIWNKAHNAFSVVCGSQEVSMNGGLCLQHANTGVDIYISNGMCVCVFVCVRAGCAQVCLTICDPMDCSLLLCPWDFPGWNIGVGYHFLLQGIFLTQGSNLDLLCLLHRQADSLSLCHLGSPSNNIATIYIVISINKT